MRHAKKGRKFGRTRGKRRAFLRGLAGNFVQRERITTTEDRARELRPLVEKLVTCAKKQNLASLRLLMQRLPKIAAYKLYHEIAGRYTNRRGGYVRIIKQSRARKNDGAKMAVLEFVKQDKKIS